MTRAVDVTDPELLGDVGMLGEDERLSVVVVHLRNLTKELVRLRCLDFSVKCRSHNGKLNID